MNNTQKTIILVIILVTLSLVLYGLCGISSLGISLFSSKTEKSGNTWTLNENFSDIEIESKISDITFYTSSDRNAKVVWSGAGNLKLDVTVKNGKLKIEEKSKFPWFFSINLNTGNAEIKVYLPKNNYDSFDLESGTGSITVSGINTRVMEIQTGTGSINVSENTTSGSINVKTGTGRINLTKVFCDKLEAKSGTGRISLTSVITKGKMDVKSGTGSIELDRCDGGSIEIDTDTGSIKGTLLSGKMFNASSDTGKVSVPASTPGGSCELKTDTGSIIIEIVNR